jgi:hypothetical protein
MRTTLVIDDDILAAARELAAVRGVTIGKVISDLARESLMPRRPAFDDIDGIPTIPRRPGGPIMTPERVRQLLEATE